MHAWIDEWLHCVCIYVIMLILSFLVPSLMSLPLVPFRLVPLYESNCELLVLMLVLMALMMLMVLMILMLLMLIMMTMTTPSFVT